MSSMRVSVIGSGYVGLVTGTCLATLGHDVTCADIDEQKIALLQAGQSPIYEPSLQNLLQREQRRGRLHFTSDVPAAVRRAAIVIIAVGTPPRPDGSADLRFVNAVAKTIGGHCQAKAVVLNKSTVPVGTAAAVARIVRRASGHHIPVVSCPEFLREGHAVEDFLHPDRIVIGTDSEWARRQSLKLFAKLRCQKLVVTPRTSELIKYAANAFLATKISFINEMANLCELTGADVAEVARGMGLDPRIGPAFLQAGIGYGGSCFPKDVSALHQMAGGNGYNFLLLKAVIEVNNAQRRRFYESIRRQLGDLVGKQIAVLGLAFKANTDDVRESAALDIVRWLVHDGAQVTVYDPKAMSVAKRQLPKNVRLTDNAYHCAQDATATLVLTEWQEFSTLDWRKVKRLMKGKAVFDGKNILSRTVLKAAGLQLHQVGRPAA